VRSSNLPAIKLYEKFKFENIGIRKKYYHDPEEDGVLMKLALVDHETMMDSLFKSILDM
jgi:ribosomal-protein-alanine N-acetyltransferase